ncbi:DNA polymerase III subunit delta' [Desulfobaculum senezii]|jgi:DNA polymerase-3 subunit delta'
MTATAQHSRIQDVLTRLVDTQPQVLLLEGGTVDERMDMAMHWARLNNCATRTACGHCPACVQIEQGVHVDIKLLDGREGKIKIDDVRELKPLFGQPPRGDGKRVVILAEAQELIVAAANALLKSLEEPCPGTLFVLLAPQRERLLPTLVSRSWVLTLPWPHGGGLDGEAADWLRALGQFAQSGTGWFAKTGAKGAVTRDIALKVVLACRKDLTAILAGRSPSPMGAQLAARLDLGRLKKFDLTLAHAEDALSLPTAVNPAMVLDWLATRTYRLLRERP